MKTKIIATSNETSITNPVSQLGLKPDGSIVGLRLWIPDSNTGTSWVETQPLDPKKYVIKIELVEGRE